MPNVLKPGSLNLLESSGPAQARNGIVLPLLLLPLLLLSCINIKDMYHTINVLCLYFFRVKDVTVEESVGQLSLKYTNSSPSLDGQ